MRRTALEAHQKGSSVAQIRKTDRQRGGPAVQDRKTALPVADSAGKEVGGQCGERLNAYDPTS